MVWSTVAINSDEALEYANSPEETGMANFLMITTLNTVVAYLYVFSHVLACPITICLAIRNPEGFGINGVHRAPEEMDDEDLDRLP